MTYPPFDPELATFLELVGDRIPPSVTPDDIPAFRAGGQATRLSDADLRRDGRIEFTERSIPGPEGSPEVSVLICRRSRGGGLGAGAPAVYHTHGGGMIMGDNRTGLGQILDWVEQLGVVVVSVEYRLAPEHPYPAGVEDCYAGLCWTAAHAGDLGIDPARLVVAGTSAGGGLAAALALMARDRGGPALIGQILMCPMLDDRAVTPSSTELHGIGVWDRVSNRTGWAALLGDAAGAPGVPAYAAPARADDLSGLPPAFIDVGSVETFRDEDLDYAARLWRAGGQAELHVWPGGFHGFDAFAPDAVLSKAARAARLDWLGRLLAG
ncbi:MAG: alpha/beta hydrolase [Actinomycetota bacterium]|nr:alpha/beta hydrolase [Actinomycetota bacterium]